MSAFGRHRRLLQFIQNKSHQACEIRNLSRDPQVAVGSISNSTEPNRVFFGRDQHLASEIFNLVGGVVVVVAKTHSFDRVDSD